MEWPEKRQQRGWKGEGEEGEKDGGGGESN